MGVGNELVLCRGELWYHFGIVDGRCVLGISAVYGADFQTVKAAAAAEQMGRVDGEKAALLPEGPAGCVRIGECAGGRGKGRAFHRHEHESENHRIGGRLSRFSKSSVNRRISHGTVW